MLQQWSEEPWSEDEDATSVHESREASDEEEADNSEPLVHEARAGQALKTFVQENEHSLI